MEIDEIFITISDFFSYAKCANFHSCHRGISAECNCTPEESKNKI